MFNYVVAVLSLIACASSSGVVAPLAYSAPAFVTAASSQVVARNYNGIAAPLISAPAFAHAAAAPVVYSTPLVRYSAGAPIAAPLTSYAAESLAVPFARSAAIPLGASLAAPVHASIPAQFATPYAAPYAAQFGQIAAPLTAQLQGPFAAPFAAGAVPLPLSGSFARYNTVAPGAYATGPVAAPFSAPLRYATGADYPSVLW